MKNLNSRDLRPFLGKFAVLLFLVFFVVIASKILLERVAMLNEEVKNTRILEANLNQKINILSDFELLGADLSGKVANSLPQSSPAISAISIIRFKAGTFGLGFGAISVSGQEKSITEGEVGNISLTFDIHGDFKNVLDFIYSLSSTAPIGQVESIETVSQGTTSTSTVVYKVFYSNLPGSIPAVEEPLVEFDESERTLIQKLAGLESPSITELTPQSPTFRGNPFGL